MFAERECVTPAVLVCLCKIQLSACANLTNAEVLGHRDSILTCLTRFLLTSTWNWISATFVTNLENKLTKSREILRDEFSAAYFLCYLFVESVAHCRGVCPVRTVVARLLRTPAYVDRSVCIAVIWLHSSYWNRYQSSLVLSSLHSAGWWSLEVHRVEHAMNCSISRRFPSVPTWSVARIESSWTVYYSCADKRLAAPCRCVEYS